MIEITLITYAVCCLVGLAFSLAGMYASSEDRRLNKRDFYATLFFTFSGFIGTVVILVLAIKFAFETRKLKLDKGW